MRALIFPNDPLISYVLKGEIKKNYFNPNNIFNEIHFVTFAKKECSINDIKITVGNAKCYIHNLSPLSIFNFFVQKNIIKSILKIIKNYKFDIVRAFNPIIHGFIAGKISKTLDLPFIISLHTNYDLDIRYLYKKNKDLRYFKYLLSKYLIEKQTLEMATHIIGKYNFASKFALDNGVSENNVSTIYNRIHLDTFKPKINHSNEDVRVICVGNLIEGKGQRTLLNAMKQIDEKISLTIVGDGEDYNLLNKMVIDYNLTKRVKFIRSIPNNELADLYQKHEIFALPIKFGGICIPALEATASGLALVMPQPIHEKNPELVSDYAEVVNNTADDFAKGINKIASNLELRKKMIADGLELISKINGDIMELKEFELYNKVIKKYENN
jgi:glycosyltransferase involved in cell wall biosynthesis